MAIITPTTQRRTHRGQKSLRLYTRMTKATVRKVTFFLLSITITSITYYICVYMTLATRLLLTSQRPPIANELANGQKLRALLKLVQKRV